MPLPKIRTVAAAHAELKRLAPEMTLTQRELHTIIRCGNVPSVKMGRSRFVDMDILIDYLNNPAEAALEII